MRQKDPLEGLSVFAAVAQVGSFSQAARRLGMSPSAVSQAISSLEKKLGTPLFRRSTRSLSLTDVGDNYLRTVAPALSQLRLAAEEASSRGGRPTGPLRLTMPRAPFDLFIAPALVAFQDSHPEVALEIAVEARLIDIVKQGYDAGLRYGNCIDKDMVAVQVAPRSEAILVASPSYLKNRAAPQSPTDLLDHRAIVCRSQETGLIMPWTLQSAGDTVQIVPTSITVVHDLASQLNLAMRGQGIVSAPTAMVAEQLAAGELTRVLSTWSSTIEALYLYFPSRRQQSAALRAFVAFLKAAPSSPSSYPGSVTADVRQATGTAYL